MVYMVPHYIAGKLYSETTTKHHDIYNPAVGEIIGQVGFASSATTDKAVSVAKKAWISWSQEPPTKRANILFKFRELLEKHQLDLARIVTREHGKTIDDAKGSIARSIELVEFHCGIVAQLQGSFSRNVSSRIDCFTERQPIGVCAGVSPFNFPIMVPVWMMIPAIASGNTFILKPSEQNPSAPIRLLELLTEAGLPDGVANCIHGDKAIVDQLLDNKDIAAITAVASTPVAEYIYKRAIANGKRSHTFGGAKNHCVVMPDADMDHAASAIVGASYGAAGERCMALSVVVIVGGEKTKNSLVKKLIPLIKAIKIDAGDVNSCDMGPLISSAHRQRVLSAIDAGVDEGATLLIDGRGFKHKEHKDGYFLGPCLFDNVTESMSIYKNEIFGPVLVIISVADFESALDLVNRHQFGNGTAIFTKDGYSAREYAERVQVGMVGINIPIPVPIANHPFGGWKRSSFGDTNMHGLESIHFYTKLKTITCKWPTTELNTNAFNMPINR